MPEARKSLAAYGVPVLLGLALCYWLSTIDEISIGDWAFPGSLAGLFANAVVIGIFGGYRYRLGPYMCATLSLLASAATFLPPLILIPAYSYPMQPDWFYYELFTLFCAAIAWLTGSFGQEIKDPRRLSTVGDSAVRDRSSGVKLPAWLVPGLVLILLLGSLSYRVFKYWNGGPVVSCESNLVNIGNALDKYAADHRGSYPAELGALTPHYIPGVPHCPAVHRDTYSTGYIAKGGRFIITCHGHNHRGSGLPPDYPQYIYLKGRAIIKP